MGFYASLREEHKLYLSRALAVPSLDLWLPGTPLWIQRVHAALVASGALSMAAAAATAAFTLLLGMSTADPPLGASAQWYSALAIPFALFYTLELALRLLLLAHQRHVRRAPVQAALRQLPHLLIVIAGWLEVAPALQRSYASRLTAVRLLRLLQPLGALDVLALRPFFRTLAMCVNDLLSVAGLYGMATLLFSSVALQLWRGLLQGACTYTDAGVSGRLSPWSLALRPCALPSCPPEQSCSVAAGGACAPLMVPLAAGPALTPTTCTPGNSPDFGATNFDNIGAAALVAFVLPTFEGWTSVMYSTWATKGYKAAIFPFFVAHIGLCGWLLLPLTMSVLTSNTKAAQEWEGAHAEELVNAAHEHWVEVEGMGVREHAAAASAAAAADADADAVPPPPAPTALKPRHVDQAGAFGARRRLNSLVCMPALFTALRAVTGDGGSGEAAAGEAGAGAGAGAAPAAWGGGAPPRLPGEPACNAALFALNQAMRDVSQLRGRRAAEPTAASIAAAAAEAEEAAVKADEARAAAHPNASPPLHQVLRAWLVRWREQCEMAVSLLLLANMIIFSCFYLGQPAGEVRVLQGIDAALVALFALEALVRCLAMGGVAVYFCNASCAFEGICTVSGIMEALLTGTAGAVGGSTPLGVAVNFFHCVRCLRFILMPRVWPAYRRLLRRLHSALPETFGALVLLALYIMGFGLWGRQMFARDYPPNSTVFPNFKTLQLSLLSVFQVADNENWDQLLKQHMAELGPSTALFFLLTFCLGTLVALNFLVTTLIEASIPYDVVVPLQAAGALAVAAAALPSANAGSGTPSSPSPRPQPPPPPAQPSLYSRLCCLFRAPASAQARVTRPPAQYKSTVTLKTGPSGAATSVTLRLTPSAPLKGASASEEEFVVLVTSAGSIKVIPGDEHTDREWNSRALVRWADSTLAWLSSAGRRLFTQCKRRCLVRGVINADGIGAAAVAGNDASSSSGAFANTSARSMKLLEALSAKAPAPSSDFVPFVSLPQQDAGASGLPATPLLCMRAAAKSWSTSPLFLSFSVLAIVASCAILALEEPRLDVCDNAAALVLRGIPRPPGCDLRATYFAANAVLAGFYLLELCINLLARGLSLSAPGTFFITSRGQLDWWSVLDVLVALGAAAGLSTLRNPLVTALRSGRSLRVLRIIARFSFLRVATSALLSSVARSLKPVVFALVLCAIVALSGLHVFRGWPSFCNSDAMPWNNLPFITPRVPASSCSGALPVVGDRCTLLPSMAQELACRASPTGANATLNYAPFPENFNTIGGALATAFELLTGENWPLFARAYMGAADTEAPGTPFPKSSSAMVVAVYFVASQVLLKHFCIGMFGGFVARTYFEDRLDILGIKELGTAQRVWVNNMRLCLTAQAPTALFFFPLWDGGVSWVDVLRARLFRALRHPASDFGLAALAAINICVLSATATTNTPALRKSIDYWSNAFTLFFLLEVCLRALALGLWQYVLSEWWLVLDGCATLASAGALLNAYLLGQASDAQATLYILARLFGFMRIFRVAHALPGVRRIMGIVLSALPVVLQLMAVHALIVYMLAIAAMNLFDGVRFGWLGFMDPVDVNFDTFWAAFVTAYRCTTGENFNGIMRELASAPPYCLPGVNCGSSFYSYAYFSVLYTLTHFYCIQLCVAIMMHVFMTMGDRCPTTGMVQLSFDMRSRFEAEWGRLDPHATHLLGQADVMLLLCRLPPPLGVAGAGEPTAPGPAHSAWGQGDSSALPTLAERVAARKLFESLALPPAQRVEEEQRPFSLRNLSLTATARRILTPAIGGGSRAGFGLAASPSRASLHGSSRRIFPSPLEPTASRGLPSSPSLSNLSSAAGSDGFEGTSSPPSTVVFQFHSVLYSLLAHANSFSLDGGVLSLRGTHTSSAVSLRAMFLMKRAFQRFHLRWKASGRGGGGESCTGDASTAFEAAAKPACELDTLRPVVHVPDAASALQPGGAATSEAAEPAPPAPTALEMLLLAGRKGPTPDHDVLLVAEAEACKASLALQQQGASEVTAELAEPSSLAGRAEFAALDAAFEQSPGVAGTGAAASDAADAAPEGAAKGAAEESAVEAPAAAAAAAASAAAEGTGATSAFAESAAAEQSAVGGVGGGGSAAASIAADGAAADGAAADGAAANGAAADGAAADGAAADGAAADGSAADGAAADDAVAEGAAAFFAAALVAADSSAVPASSSSAPSLMPSASGAGAADAGIAQISGTATPSAAAPPRMPVAEHVPVAAATAAAAAPSPSLSKASAGRGTGGIAGALLSSSMPISRSVAGGGASIKMSERGGAQGAAPAAAASKGGASPVRSAVRAVMAAHRIAGKGSRSGPSSSNEPPPGKK